MGQKRRRGGGEERLEGGGRFFCSFWVGGVILTSEYGLSESDIVCSKVMKNFR